MKIFDFTGTNGQSPWNGPLEVAPDLLYGSITSGGAGGSGLIYRYVPSTSTWTTAHAFGFAESGTHFGNLCIGIDGRMYGMGASGGINFQGSIYSFNPTNNGVICTASSMPLTAIARAASIPYGLATGIDEADRSPRFMLSPNPAPGNSTLSWAEPLKASASVRIADATGRLLHEQLLVAGTERVELSANPGLHFVSVIAAGKASTLKWSVQ
ncbi:MAG: T9SS type A sorting domain-containing protein [Flavobacteriales bacterium]|nr:T9SS type A sorting domain-containing protein [Flavobacteriales bacterium]